MRRTARSPPPLSSARLFEKKRDRQRDGLRFRCTPRYDGANAFTPEPIPMSLRALLFDLDGTLIDSDARHFEAFRRVSAPYGVDFDEAFFLHHMSGHSSAEICGALFPSLSAAGHRRIADDKEALFRHLLTSGASAIRGAVELVDWAAARKDRDLD